MADSLDSVERVKAPFGDLDLPREKIVYETLRTGLRIYLKGMHNNYGQKSALAEALQEEGGTALRLGGQLLANLFELSADDIGAISGELLDDDKQFDQLHGTFSFVAGRLAEGLYEGGETELAESVAEKFVTHPELKPGVEEYFRLCAGDLFRGSHA